MIDTVEDLIKAAFRLPVKWKDTFVLKLEDWEAQLEIWSKDPVKLSMDEATHKGIRLLADRLLGKEEKRD